MSDARQNLDELVTVSLRMPRALSQVLDIQAAIAGRTKTDLLIGGVSLLLSSPLLLRCVPVYDRSTLRNTCILMQAMLAQEVQHGAEETAKQKQVNPENVLV